MSNQQFNILLQQQLRRLIRQVQQQEEEKSAAKIPIKIGDVFAIMDNKIPILMEITKTGKQEVEVRVLGTNGEIRKVPRRLVGECACHLANMVPFLSDISDKEWDVDKIREREVQRRQAERKNYMKTEELEAHEVGILRRFIGNLVKRNILTEPIASHFMIQMNLHKYAHSEKFLEHIRQLVNQDIAAAGFEVTNIAQLTPSRIIVYMAEIPLWQ